MIPSKLPSFAADELRKRIVDVVGRVFLVRTRSVPSFPSSFYSPFTSWSSSHFFRVKPVPGQVAAFTWPRWEARVWRNLRFGWSRSAGGQGGPGGSASTMARNAEKAMTALARFRQAQLEEGKVKERRPFLASECNELPKAEKWRRQIIGEISKKVAQIQNAGLGEFRIRDLNDEINKLLREKGHWEVRIKELGGPDYGKVGPKMLDHEGKEVPGNRGYKYFGAAKDLPGVRELFEKEPLPPPRKTRAELMKAIDAEYYGYRDEDDGILEPLEQEHEKKVIAEAVEKWKTEREARLARGDKEEEEEEINIYAVNDEESDEESAKEKEGEEGQQKFIAHVPVPSQQEIEEALVRRKKMELLQKYASETLLAQSEEAKRLLGF
ncbi:pre-mRNA-splicing factor ISY1 homolog isoform X2 [Phascolarctos cinereus]|uniref:Pre-mRNA-splicing factor ISY1 homolog n=1 Tax=Phascolarctos cinereus TaxID=38626 RepID=A0A6P5JRH9_PHACI|nr:pre-mRNA-splicing factor ISY1 homolog isoform X2 [Phascolarctos cinereus]